jgi:hypothetical protein
MTADTINDLPTLAYAPKTGDVVLCYYRLPCPWQHWIHPVWVGVVQEPGDDPASWNGHNSERSYCERCGYLPVLYGAHGETKAFRQHDSIDTLFPAPEGRTEPWMVEDEAEGWALEGRGLAYCARHREERGQLIGYAMELVEARWGRRAGGPLGKFARTGVVREAGRGRAVEQVLALRDELLGGRKEHELGGDSQAAYRMRRLAGLIGQAPADHFLGG